MGYLALDRYRNIEADLSAFCERWKVAELALLDLPEAERTDPDAELDLLVTIRPDAEWSLFDRVHMQDELSEIFCRRAHFYSWDRIGRVRQSTANATVPKCRASPLCCCLTAPP